MSENRNALESRVEECLVSIAWTHKVHEKQGDIYSHYSKCVNIASIVATSLTGSGTLTLLAFDEFWMKVATVALAFLSLVLFICSVAFSFSENALSHRQAAKVFLSLREEGRDLKTLFADESYSYQQLQSKYEALRGRYLVACTLEPQTTDRAVEKADKALKDGESTVSDDERRLLAPTNGSESL